MRCLSSVLCAVVLLHRVVLTSQQAYQTTVGPDVSTLPLSSVTPTYTPLPTSTTSITPQPTGGAQTSSTSAVSNAGGVAGGVIAAVVIVGAIAAVGVVLYCLYIRSELRGGALGAGVDVKEPKKKLSAAKELFSLHITSLLGCVKDTTKTIGSFLLCFTSRNSNSGSKDDAYEPIQMDQTEPVDITASVSSHPYDTMNVNMQSVTASVLGHHYEPTDMNTSSIVTTSLRTNPYEPVDVNMASIVSASLNPYEPVEVGKPSDRDPSPCQNKDSTSEPRNIKPQETSEVEGDRAVSPGGFVNQLAIVGAGPAEDDSKPDDNQASQSALYGSYDTPRPMDPYDIPRGSSISHPLPPGELYDTPRSSQYDKPRTSVSIHSPKTNLNPLETISDNAHTYDVVP